MLCSHCLKILNNFTLEFVFYVKSDGTMEDAGGLKPLQTHGSDSCHCPLLTPWSPGPYPALHSLPYSRAVTKSPWLGEAHIPPSPSTWPGAWVWEQKGSGLSPRPMAPWGGQEGRYHCRSLVAAQYILCATQQGAPATTTQESRAPQHGGCNPWAGAHSPWVGVVGPWEEEIDFLILTQGCASSFCTKPHKSCG